MLKEARDELRIRQYHLSCYADQFENEKKELEAVTNKSDRAGEKLEKMKQKVMELRRKIRDVRSGEAQWNRLQFERYQQEIAAYERQLEIDRRRAFASLQKGHFGPTGPTFKPPSSHIVIRKTNRSPNQSKPKVAKPHTNGDINLELTPVCNACLPVIREENGEDSKVDDCAE